MMLDESIAASREARHHALLELLYAALPDEAEAVARLSTGDEPVLDGWGLVLFWGKAKRAQADVHVGSGLITADARWRACASVITYGETHQVRHGRIPHVTLDGKRAITSYAKKLGLRVYGSTRPLEPDWKRSYETDTSDHNNDPT